MRPEDGTPRRGRPSGPTGSSLGEYLRGLRLAHGWTIRDLAVRVGLPPSSASYISQLESGDKAPNESLAIRLVEQLGDEKGIFRLWAMTGRRKDPSAAAAARRELARLLNDPTLMHDPRFTHPDFARLEGSRLRMERATGAESGARGVESRERGDEPRWIAHDQLSLGAQAAASLPAQGASEHHRLVPTRSAGGNAYRVQILPSGLDPEGPGMMLSATGQPVDPEFIRLSPEALPASALLHPFAYRVTKEVVQRVASLIQPGDVVVFTREPGPILPHEVYAVRHAGRIELAHLLWNGRQLLLLPDADRSDFVVLEAASEEAVQSLVVGHMATVIRARS